MFQKVQLRVCRTLASSTSSTQDSRKKNAAYIATIEIVADPNWPASSGATNRITPYLGNLNIKVDYSKSRISAGNGNRLLMPHIGHTLYTFSTRTTLALKFKLKNILPVLILKEIY